MILCVTGPMAAGKNAASEILESMGFASVDADLLGHQAVELAKDEILREFHDLARDRGIELLDSEGKINRRALGSLIFGNEELVRRQEEIVFPHINRLFDQFIDSHKAQDLAINATVLYKVPLIKRVDSVLFVDAPFFKRLKRAKKRDNLPSRQIIQRFRRQKNLFAKYKFSVADIGKVRNTGSKAKLEKQILRFLAERR